MSVRVITYNQADYIAQTLDSILAQQTSFPYEIVVGDDGSTDGTAEILQQYAASNAEKFKIKFNKENIGRLENFVETFHRCTGKYVALLDGDDYWTDPFKLQKQVDYLDAHPDYSMCFHRAAVLDQAAGTISDWNIPSIVKSHYTLDDLFVGSNFIPTMSAMFRRGIIPTLPDWFKKVSLADFSLHVLHSQYGAIGFIDETMAVYRQHGGGVYSSASRERNQLRSLETREILGKNLRLENRMPYRITLTRMYAQYASRCGKRREYGKAWSALRKAIALAPPSLMVKAGKSYARKLFRLGRK